MKINERSLLRAGFFVLAFAGFIILGSIIVWLILAVEERKSFTDFISGFPSIAIVTMLGAVGISKWIENFKGGA